MGGLGGTDDDEGIGVAADPAGNVYLTGWFQLRVAGGGPGSVVLEAAPDLRQWEALATNIPVSGTSDFSFPTGAYPRRFFRARQ